MTTEPPAGHPEAIVRPDAAGRRFTVERIPPCDSLAEFVDYYWLVRWHVHGRHRQQVVPQPRVHLAAEQGRLLVHGVTRKPFFRTLEGSGQVLGAAFHAGGFRPLLRASVGGISGSVRAAAELLGVDDLPVARRILGTGDGVRMVAALEDYLLEVGPEPDPTGRQATELVAEAERRVEITRAELLAAHAGMSLRSLQRLFTEYVGVGPKWVIQRFRILDAVAAAHAGAATDWATLARELGFSDQAHLTRVFTQVVGTPPASYQREVGSARPPATAGSGEPSRPPSPRPGRAAPGRPATARGRSPR
jgi:AraC-like DNA-binding protein